MGCHSFLQGNLPDPGSNPYLPDLLHCSQILYLLSHGGKSHICVLMVLKQFFFSTIKTFFSSLVT